MKKIVFFLFSLFAISVSASETEFDLWKRDFLKQAKEQGISQITLDKYLPKMTYIQRAVNLDRSQPEFRQNFCAYLQTRITPLRIKKAKDMMSKHRELLKQVEIKYGVPAEYLVSFWALETGFGQNMGSFPILSSLATLSYDNRRKEFFTSQLIALLKIIQKEDIEPPLGSWAGAFGHFQFIPSTFIDYAVDGDGDGKRDIVHSFSDAVHSAAYYLKRMGWKKEEIWGEEFDGTPENYIKEKDKKGNLIIYKTSKNGEVLFNFPNEGVLLSPLGKMGPTFITYKNFDVIKKWNKSDLYALSVGILADEIIGRKTYDVNACQIHDFFTRNEIMEAQTCLRNDELYTGEIDGVDGPLTKEAIIAYQKRHNLFPDGYLSKEVLAKLSKNCQKEVIGETP